MRNTERNTERLDETGWVDRLPRYRERWERRGTRDATERWDDVEPGYRIGDELRGEYAGRPWSDVEPEFKRRWTERHSEKPWDRFLDRAQDIWDDLTREPGASPHAGERGSHDEASGR